jgi:hypothetical protein
VPGREYPHYPPACREARARIRWPLRGQLMGCIGRSQAEHCLTCVASKGEPALLSLPAHPSQRIKSPLLWYQIGALAISLCRFVRDFAGSGAGPCRRVMSRPATSEHPPSTHGLRRPVRCCRPLRSQALGCGSARGLDLALCAAGPYVGGPGRQIAWSSPYRTRLSRTRWEGDRWWSR